MWRLLQAVWRDGAYANLVWPRLMAEADLEEADRGFATELGYGLLRHWGQLCTIIEGASGRSTEDLDPEVLWVLAIGAQQILHMRIPAHAAVNETVNLAGAVGLRSTRGLVNAVLRRIAKNDLRGWLDQVLEKALSPEDALGLETAHPAWIATEISRALEREGAGDELTEALMANNAPARVTLALLPGLSTPAQGEARVAYSPLGVYRQGNPSHDERVRAGRARVQDEGSQLAALLAARAVSLTPGDRILDACAGPGGKAAVLAAEAIKAGAQLTAIDRSEHRAQLVRESLHGLVDHPENWEVLHADTLDFLSRPGAALFDRILLDAPCSGLGALRRRPEARWTKSSGEIAPLVDLQRRLASACFRALRPGGYLFYVTCSPVVEETTGLVQWLTAHERDIELLDTGSLLDGVALKPIDRARVGSAVQLWPHRHHTDAMFMQAIRRAEAVRLGE